MKQKLMSCKWGGFVALAFVAANSYAASFDCAKAGTKIEKMICASPALNKLDSDLASSYKEAVGKDASIKQEQQAWMKERNKCPTEACLEESYKERIDNLTNFIVRHDRQALAGSKAQEDSVRSRPAEKFTPSPQEKSVLELMHTSAMCAGFYSRYLPGASQASCSRQDMDSQLGCLAWASKGRYLKMHDYSTLETRKFPPQLAEHIREIKAEFARSYSNGERNFADNKTSMTCKTYMSN